MTDPRYPDLRAALIHLEGVEAALERASTRGPLVVAGDDVVAAMAFVDELRLWLERALRTIDPVAAGALARRADEPRTAIGS